MISIIIIIIIIITTIVIIISRLVFVGPKPQIKRQHDRDDRTCRERQFPTGGACAESRRQRRSWQLSADSVPTGWATACLEVLSG